jgi:hypothetical protein
MTFATNALSGNYVAPLAGSEQNGYLPLDLFIKTIYAIIHVSNVANSYLVHYSYWDSNDSFVCRKGYFTIG